MYKAEEQQKKNVWCMQIGWLGRVSFSLLVCVWGAWNKWGGGEEVKNGHDLRAGSLHLQGAKPNFDR